MSRPVPVVIAFVSLVMLAGRATAQVGGSGFAPETAAAIKAVVLTAPKAHTLIKAMEELNAYVSGSPDAAKMVVASLRKPFDERVAMMAADPKAMAIFKKHGLTAGEYSIGILAVRATAWASGGGRGGLADLATPGNVALFKSNPDVLSAFTKAEQARVGAPPK
jgi:hypothetical protein